MNTDVGKGRKKETNNNIQIESCLDTLRFLNESTDDFLYLWDLQSGRLWFFGTVQERFALKKSGETCYQVEDWVNIVYPKDRPALEENLERIMRGELTEHDMDYRLVDRDGNRVWINCRGKVQMDSDGCPLVLIGRVSDIAEQKAVARKVQDKLDFAQSILDSAKVLAEERDMHQATQRMLAYVGEYYQADRAYFFAENACDTDYWKNTHEWCRDGAASQLAGMQKLPKSLLGRWMSIFERKNSVIITDMNLIQKINPEEWKLLKEQGVHRLIATAIWEGRKIIGFIGVDNPKHCVDDDAHIHMTALFVANRLHQNATKERLGELLNFHYSDILKATEIGLWVIRINEETGKCEMYADEMMHRIMGAEKDLTPEACYEHWYSHINEGYYTYISRSVETMIESEKVVQLQYTWNHPTLGDVKVRCTGVRVEDNNGMICLEGYHRIVSDIAQTHFLPETMSSETFEYNERKGSIYFHTDRALLAGEETREKGFPECWITREIVHPHFAEKFAELFRNVQYKEEVDGMELMLKTKQGEYSWFKLKTRYLSEMEKDRNMLLVQLNAANQERIMELEHMRLHDFYHASLSETIAYVELDLESKRIREAGGLWADSERICKEQNVDFPQLLAKNYIMYVQECNGERVFQPTDFPDIKQMLYEGKKTQRYHYKCLIGGEWRWVELVIHTFAEQFAENMSALLYLKDVDVETKREIAQREAAEQDPLTSVYNRRAFKEQVRQYMEKPNGQQKGVLILLDIDDFKSVNDKYGHMSGDGVLKHMASCLRAVFCDDELVGRFGGDEFMVFLKGEKSREQLNQCMSRFFEMIGTDIEIPVCCSAGIVFTDAANFSYEQSMRQVDAALYWSKQNGKNQYCYADDRNS